MKQLLSSVVLEIDNQNFETDTKRKKEKKADGSNVKEQRRETGSECEKGREWYIPMTSASFSRKQSYLIVAKFIKIRYKCTTVNKAHTYIYRLTPRNTVSPKFRWISHLFQSCYIPCPSYLPKCYGRNNFSWTTRSHVSYFYTLLL